MKKSLKIFLFLLLFVGTTLYSGREVLYADEAIQVFRVRAYEPNPLGSLSICYSPVAQSRVMGTRDCALFGEVIKQDGVVMWQRQEDNPQSWIKSYYELSTVRVQQVLFQNSCTVQVGDKVKILTRPLWGAEEHVDVEQGDHCIFLAEKTYQGENDRYAAPDFGKIADFLCQDPFSFLLVFPEKDGFFEVPSLVIRKEEIGAGTGGYVPSITEKAAPMPLEELAPKLIETLEKYSYPQ